MGSIQKCQLADGWINKTLYIHIIEHYLVIKKNEVLTHDEPVNHCATLKKTDSKCHKLYDQTDTKCWL